MKKRIIIAVLVLVLCLSVFAACDNTPAESTGLQAARDFVKGLYRDKAEITSGDYELTTSVVVQGVTYTIDWSILDKDGNATTAAVVGEAKDGKVTVTIDTKLIEDVPYVLTATIKDAEGNSITLDLNFIAPQIQTLTVAEFLKKKEDETTIYAIKGWAVASGASKDSSGKEVTASFVIADSTGALFSYNKFYVEVGKMYIVYGTRSSNAGVAQIGTTSILPVATEETFTEPTATELAASDIDLSKLSQDTIGDYTGKYYKITGSFAAKSGSYVNANYNKKQLLSLYMSDTMKTAAEAMDGKQVIVYGYVRGFSSSYLTVQVSKIELDPNGGTEDSGDSGKDESAILAKKNAYFASVVETPVAGTEYKLAMWQNNNGEVYYATGAMNSYYLGTTTDVASAAVAKLEATEGGYFLKLGDKYVRIVGRDNNGSLSTNISLVDAGETVFKIGANHELICTATYDTKSGDFFLGTYGTFNTISASAVSYISKPADIDVNNFVARLVVATASSAGGDTGADTPVAPSADKSATYNFATSSTNKGTVLNDTSALTLFKASTTNTDLVSVAVTKIYDGNGSGGAWNYQSGLIKSGTRDAAGQLVLTFVEGKKVAKVEIKCHAFYAKDSEHSTSSDKISVNGSDAVLVPHTETVTPSVLTFDLTTASNVVTIDIKNRAVIFEIIVTFAE